MKYEGKFKCRACRREWDGSEVREDPRRIGVPVCADICCDGTCDRVKEETRQCATG